MNNNQSEEEKAVYPIDNRTPLTMGDFNMIPAGDVFLHGLAKNNPEGLWMISDPKYYDKDLLWLAKKSDAGESWAIYCHWKEKGLDFVRNAGDKVTDRTHIKRLVNCEDDVLALYRL